MKFASIKCKMSDRELPEETTPSTKRLFTEDWDEYSQQNIDQEYRLPFEELSENVSLSESFIDNSDILWTLTSFDTSIGSFSGTGMKMNLSKLSSLSFRLLGKRVSYWFIVVNVTHSTCDASAMLHFIAWITKVTF